MYLNPFFIRSAFEPVKAHRDALLVKDLNPFFIRSAFELPEGLHSHWPVHLNPFFIRSAFEHKWCTARGLEPHLNPFFIRSAFERLEIEPREFRVSSIPSSSGPRLNISSMMLLITF